MFTGRSSTTPSTDHGASLVVNLRLFQRGFRLCQLLFQDIRVQVPARHVLLHLVGDQIGDRLESLCGAVDELILDVIDFRVHLVDFRLVEVILGLGVLLEEFLDARPDFSGVVVFVLARSDPGGRDLYGVIHGLDEVVGLQQRNLLDPVVRTFEDGRLESLDAGPRLLQS